jgi:hypothetical protein
MYARKAATAASFLAAFWRDFDPVQQFGLADDRDANLVNRRFGDTLDYRLGRAAHDAGTRIGVQHVARH